MSKNLGGWIHSFTVTETNTHKKGYTVYKITSIVFPRSVPEALTCVTVWKRFSEVKRLYKDLLKRHKSLHLRGTLPQPGDTNFFKRFDPMVIQERKDYILKLLDYVAQHPALYKSHPFLNFFENTHTPNVSPEHANKSNIEHICDDLDIPYEDEVLLVDPRKDNDEPSCLINSFVSARVDDTVTSPGNDKSEDDTASIISTPSMFQFDGDNNNDYIYEAAYDFSRAVQAEVNQEYREAFDKYKSGIDRLLSGSKDDTNEDRKSIAKAKVSKYMQRSEEIYEKYILPEVKNEKKPLQLSVDQVDSMENDYLERPWNQLSKFKVMQIIDSVMQVQDVTEKRVYIMKAIEKPSTNSSAQSIFLPKNVPFMVQLIGYYQSETNIYLLLQQAKGGKLYDYIQTYTPTAHVAINSLDEIFSEPKSDEPHVTTKREMPEKVERKVSVFDNSFLALLENSTTSQTEEKFPRSPESHISKKVIEKTKSVEDYNDYIPSFDVLSEDMDVNDLVSCSQKLLRSVSNTLEQYKDMSLADVDYQSRILDQVKRTVSIDSEISVSSSAKTDVENHLSDAQRKSTSRKEFLMKRVILPEAIVKQWARELITAIEALHLKGIILGDLHSDNVLLGSKGQLLLSYFHKNQGADSSLHLKIDPTSERDLYVAPERPLTKKSDWWSFGVILFELITGYSFRSCHPGGLSSYYSVQYPEIEVTETVSDLLENLLQCCPESRYDVVQIKAHQFFEGTNWAAVTKDGMNCN